MLSLSLGRDGWVEAAAPGRALNAHFCAARRLLLYSSFLLAILEVAPLETLGVHRPFDAAMKKVVGTRLHTSQGKHPKRWQKLAGSKFRSDQCLIYACNAPRCRRASCAPVSSLPLQT